MNGTSFKQMLTYISDKGMNINLSISHKCPSAPNCPSKILPAVFHLVFTWACLPGFVYDSFIRRAVYEKISSLLFIHESLPGCSNIAWWIYKHNPLFITHNPIQFSLKYHIFLCIRAEELHKMASTMFCFHNSVWSSCIFKYNITFNVEFTFWVMFPIYISPTWWTVDDNGWWIVFLWLFTTEKYRSNDPGWYLW